MDVFFKVGRYISFLIVLYISGVFFGRILLSYNAEPEGCVVDKYYTTNAFNGFYIVVVEAPSSLFGKELAAEFRIEVDQGTYDRLCIDDLVETAPVRSDLGAMFGSRRLVS